MTRSEAIEATLEAIVDRASDAGQDSCGEPMSKVRTALIEAAAALLVGGCCTTCAEPWPCTAYRADGDEAVLHAPKGE